MATQKKYTEKTLPIGRVYMIGNEKYIIYKEKNHIYIMLNDDIVFSNKNNPRMSVSRWLKNKKK